MEQLIGLPRADRSGAQGNPLSSSGNRSLDGVLEPGYQRVNPQGFVPTLEYRQVRLVQSGAIIEYLDERWPDPPLLPAAPEERARVRALAAMVVSDIQPLNNQRVQDGLLAEFGLDEAALRRWYAKWIAEGFTAIERFLRDSMGTGRFCHGDAPTLADILSRAAGVQRPALVLRSRALPADPPDRCRLPRAGAVPRRGAGAPERLPGVDCYSLIAGGGFSLGSRRPSAITRPVAWSWARTATPEPSFGAESDAIGCRRPRRRDQVKVLAAL